jgi:hypothetical protein
MSKHAEAFSAMHAKIIDAMDEFEKGTGSRIEDVTLERVEVTNIEDITKRVSRQLRITLAPTTLGWK